MFYGFKLHIVINDKGEILDFLFSKGNVDDREPLKNKNFHDKIFGKLIALLEPKLSNPDMHRGMRHAEHYSASTYR